MPEITVIVPIHQSAWSIERTVTSIIRQRFTNFEVLLIDDGSTDDLDARLSPFLAKDSRLRLLKQPNAGVAATRNRGFREARAPIVASIDADDMWHPDFLSACKQALEEVPEAPFVFTYYFRIDQDDMVFPFAPATSPPRHDFKGLLSLNSVGNGSGAVFRREAVLRVGGYDESLQKRGLVGAEDWKLLLDLARLAEPIVVERYLTAYRLSQKSMSMLKPERQLRAICAVIDELGSEYPDVKQSLLRDARTTMVGWLLPVLIRRRNWSEALQWMRVGYLDNPLWFLNPSVRRFHRDYAVAVIRPTLARLRGKPLRDVYLADLEIEGEKPFAFLREMECEAGTLAGRAAV